MEKEIRDNIHRYYDEVFNCKWDRHARMLELFPMINPNDYILDYGCGVGHISHYFEIKYKCNVDAVDISEEEIAKSKLAWGGGGGHTSKIQFQTINNFDFPTEKYTLVFSSSVVEHVHNVGNYLYQINRMLKQDGYLIIGLPNIITPFFIWSTFFISTNRLIHHSKEMLIKYNKAKNHINAWDAYHFVTLLASCGFELEQYVPIEGVTQPYLIWRKIPIIGKYLPQYTNKMNRGNTGNWSYSMFFRFRKVKNVIISISE